MELFEHGVVLELQVDLLIELLDLRPHRLILQDHLGHPVVVEFFLEEQQLLVQLAQPNVLLQDVVVF